MSYFKEGDKVKSSNRAIEQGMKIPNNSVVVRQNSSGSDMVTIEYISERTGKKITARWHEDFLELQGQT